MFSFKLKNLKFLNQLIFFKSKFYFVRMRRKNLKIFKFFDDRRIGAIPRIFLTSIFVVFSFFFIPSIIDFTNQQLLKNNEFQNNSKAILAYTLKKDGKVLSNENLNEKDLLIDIFSLNDLETDTVRLDASTIKQLFEDTNYKLKDVRESKLVKPVALTLLPEEIKMIESTNARKITYSLKNSADYKCKVVESQNDGMLLSINNSRFWVKIIGLFNVYNILATYAVARQFGFDHNKILTSLSCLDSPEGRFQVIKSANSVIGIVDYAHTEDALNNVLLAIQAMKNKNNKLITVIGCGGDRDKSKRGHIAQVACKLSTQVIFTADNPRSEEPIMIIDDMTSVLDAIQYSKVLVIPDRKQAIKTACSLAVSEDIILLAGKGHEKYQEIKGKKVPFDDLVELKESLNIN